MISHKHRVIFVHIPKTAGQSIEHVFLSENGLAWGQRAALLLRQNRDPAAGPERLAHLFACEYVSCGHMAADDFSKYFKFAVIRDPLARLASAYRFRHHSLGISFRQFVEEQLITEPLDLFSGRSRHIFPQSCFVCGGDGNVLVDKLIIFERLADEWPELSRTIFGRSLPLPLINVSPGPRDSLYDPYTRSVARAYYQRDFGLLDCLSRL